MLAYMAFVFLFIRTFHSSPNLHCLEATIGVNQHLGIALNSLVKLLIRHLRIVDADLMTDDEAWFRLSRDDEISQVAVVGFDVALTRAKL